MPTPEQKAAANAASATKRYTSATNPKAKAAAAKSVRANVQRMRGSGGKR